MSLLCMWKNPTVKLPSSGICLRISSVTRWTPRCCGRRLIFLWNHADPTWIPRLDEAISHWQQLWLKIKIVSTTISVLDLIDFSWKKGLPQEWNSCPADSPYWRSRPFFCCNPPFWRISGNVEFNLEIFNGISNCIICWLSEGNITRCCEGAVFLG